MPKGKILVPQIKQELFYVAPDEKGFHLAVKKINCLCVNHLRKGNLSF